jgi:16S rRNA pseudouridine516 synthase
MMRLDKYISGAGLMSRKECAKAVKKGRITINGMPVTHPETKVQEGQDEIALDGTIIPYMEYTYIMLNKPEGYVSSTDDPSAPTVLELVDERYSRMGLFPCGRLDRDTTGLLILTDNGPLAHRLLSPKYHCEKTYLASLAFVLDDETVNKLEAGVVLDGKITKPAKIEILGPTKVNITLTEGRYHQVKRMFEAVGNKVLKLTRTFFASIPLDPSLESGEWRMLTADEIEALEAAPNKAKDEN